MGYNFTSYLLTNKLILIIINYMAGKIFLKEGYFWEYYKISITQCNPIKVTTNF